MNQAVAEQAQASAPFPLTFSLTVAGESQYIFRGINILPQVDINPAKAYTEGINDFPAFRDLLRSVNFSPKQFIALVPQIPNRQVEVARDSSIIYVDGNVSAYGLTAGGFFTTGTQDRPKGNFFGPDPIFDAYREFDAYLSYSHSLGPVVLTAGGTYYHVTGNSEFDTAELNISAAYTPPQFRYVTATITYDYDSAFAYDPEYLDGHYLEAKVSGEVPLYKRIVTFDPYALLAAGAGIVPRAFNRASLPTYFSNRVYSEVVAGPVLHAVLNNGMLMTGNLKEATAAAAEAAFNPADLDRDFDLNNVQIGFRVPVYITRLLTVTADGNYSYPLGNLRGGVYNQKDQFWAGVSLNLTF